GGGALHHRRPGVAAPGAALSGEGGPRPQPGLGDVGRGGVRRAAPRDAAAVGLLRGHLPRAVDAGGGAGVGGLVRWRWGAQLLREAGAPAAQDGVRGRLVGGVWRLGGGAGGGAGRGAAAADTGGGRRLDAVLRRGGGRRLGRRGAGAAVPGGAGADF